MPAPRIRKRLLKVLAILAAAMLLGAAGLFGVYWYNWEQQVVWNSWAVPLPGGGSVEYRNQSPRTHSFGPSDTTKLLVWKNPRGRERQYQIGMTGAGYRGLELRGRDDGGAIWLIATDRNQVVATLDLANGQFTDEDGGVIDSRREQSTEMAGHPKWATLSSGRVLGRKDF
jgi:hypothetical protein